MYFPVTKNIFFSDISKLPAQHHPAEELRPLTQVLHLEVQVMDTGRVEVITIGEEEVGESLEMAAVEVIITLQHRRGEIEEVGLLHILEVDRGSSHLQFYIKFQYFH